ncbi:Bug family tripartite tricarboxylate transporter substrate binding protein [Sabulicella rubraurantiaca]|uniref:Bug family tripartite tricarboxylate transporter substrate binding protein n=1 Tax=Sabulicella rubraurantiaca TaxID=2811429 RepID=UPI001A95C477|nr:tripartite tricarboxylate transporter substrate-binding protein [Sabulicella rubraurantiaca]
MHRRALLASALVAPLAAPAFAQGSPLRLVVPFAPGGTSDILARILAPEMSRILGQNVVVENRSGANGNLGAELVSRAAPDGSALLITDAGALATAPALFPRLSFDVLRDLAPVNLLIYAPYILAVHPSVQARNAQELAELAKRAPNTLNVANSGVGAANHLTAVLLAQHWGANLTQVPYRGGAAALTAVAAGEAQIIINGATATAPFTRDGRLRAIAVSGPKRLEGLDVPTFAELGWPATESGTWQGVFAPGPTPAPVIARLDGALRQILAQPEIARRMADLGADVRAMGPEPFKAWLANEAESWGRVVRANNIRPE